MDKIRYLIEINSGFVEYFCGFVRSFLLLSEWKEKIVRIIRFIGVACVIGLFFLCIVAIDEVGEHPDKIWLHRCNSMEKLYEHSERYSNFEVDIE